MKNRMDFAEMAMALHHEPDVTETLEGIVRHARDGLACDHVGIHVLHNREVETAAATDPLIERADQLQMELGEGPCLEAVLTSQTFVVDDTATDPRWTRFGPLAAELGLHSIMSTPLRTATQTMGALNFYCADPRMFDEDDVSVAQIFAAHASVALSVARHEEGLRLAIDARHLIGQAQGILMERFGLTADKAFVVLRRYSQNSNTKLREVAQHIIDTRELPTSQARPAQTLNPN